MRVFRSLWLLAFACALSAQTYSKDVAPIVQEKCARCHRPGDIAPFPLTNFRQVSAYAEDIARVVEERKMPPWKPVEGFGQFRDNFGLTADERETLLAWIRAGTPEGDPADLPPAPPDADSPWHLGEPDLVLTAPEYTPPPEAKDTYRCFVLPVGLTETKYVRAVQALPGNPAIVHHVLFYIDETGASERLDARDPEPGYNCFGGPLIPLGIGSGLGGWAPGTRAQPLPDGIAMLLPRTARIVMQVHYYPQGRVETDQTRMGLWFADRESVTKRLVQIPIVNTRFEIPPGAEDYEVRAQQVVFPFLTGQAITVAPHMHLLGKEIKVEVIEPGGRVQPLIYIDRWDFNWQGFYTFTEPVRLRLLSTIRVTARYDNSENNPHNPHRPLKPVRWGEGTEDEMCLAFLGVVFDAEFLGPL
jgi:hypothetical protein